MEQIWYPLLVNIDTFKTVAVRYIDNDYSEYAREGYENYCDTKYPKYMDRLKDNELIDNFYSLNIELEGGGVKCFVIVYKAQYTRTYYILHNMIIEVVASTDIVKSGDINRVTLDYVLLDPEEK